MDVVLEVVDLGDASYFGLVEGICFIESVSVCYDSSDEIFASEEMFASVSFEEILLALVR